MRERIYNWLKQNPGIKAKVHFCLVHPYRSRPRWWVRNFLMPFIIKKGKGAYISSSVRRDLYPFNKFEIGAKSVIEANSVLNNGMGNIKIGDNCLIGIGSVILGEIVIGNHVGTGQYCVFTGLNHNYESLNSTFDLQGTYADAIVIEDDVVTGSHVIILPGVRIGTHSVISAGSVVTRSIPQYSLVSGNPAKVVFNFKTGQRVN
ncbi:MAG: hypothetical protein ACD_77C00477G0033 [uncultured bacterium]|nr:MAG: hypothetical protein ACD_77C00477G0033 [uncultured bacterium]HBY02706.1 acetyltransferase [Rikenellaceae bacterium]